MSEPRRIEVNPGEWVLINPDSLHVKEYEAVFADAMKIGHDEHELLHIISFTGRINNTDEHTTFTVLLSPEDGWKLTEMLLDQYEWLLDAQRRSDESH